MTDFIYAIIAAVALQRLGEVAYAARNTRALKARGGLEVGASHYPFMVALHAGWLIAIVVALPSPPQFNVVAFAVFLVMQVLRLWILKTLGPYWTTRIISVPDAPLIRTGPYRYVRHPNYVIVAIEILMLPLSFGEWQVAVVFSVLNALMLAWRIHVEERALSSRRSL
jgi:methyltransferase